MFMRNPSIRKWRTVFGCILAIVLSVIAISTVSFSQSAHEEAQAVPVRVSIAASAAVVSGLRYSANITPRRTVELAFKVGGYVNEIATLPGPDGIPRDVRAGDRLKQGMLLARLDVKDYAVRASQAKASLEEARASLSMASKDYERNESLVKGGYVAKSDFDRKKESLDVAGARVDVALAQMDQANNQLADSVLKSPLDGIVASRFVERGTLVASGTRAFVLVDLSTVKAVFGVPDALLSHINPGETLSVVVDALNQHKFQGIVTAVSPSADAKSRVFDVEVTLQNPDSILKGGMIATVLVDDVKEPAPLLSAQPAEHPMMKISSIPLQSVVRPPDNPKGYMVFVAAEKNGQWYARARYVALGDVIGRNVNVLQGISAGERVITAGATIVHDGALLSIVP